MEWLVFQQGKCLQDFGNVVKVEDLIKECISRTKKILDEKNELTEEEKNIVAKKVGIGALIFSNLSTTLIKDSVFVWENVFENIDKEIINSDEVYNIFKNIYEYENILKQTAEKYEPSILTTYLLDLAKSFNQYYNKHRISTDDVNLIKLRKYNMYNYKQNFSKWNEYIRNRNA